MAIALVDNGSLEPAAHLHVRAVAAAVAARCGAPVAAVSWRHSDRIAPEALGGTRAWTLGPWVRAQRAGGVMRFVFVPFFINPRGAIVGALRSELGALALETGGFDFAFSDGLDPSGGAGAPSPRPLTAILADQVRGAAGGGRLVRPAVIVVDHGSPSPGSALLRDAIASELRGVLGAEAVSGVAAASMESPEGPDFAFNRPLFAEQLGAPGFDRGDVVVAPLFLSPGRHAGPGGDLARTARAAEGRGRGLRCHFAGLAGAHPRVPEILALSLRGMIGGRTS